jgi:serine/threonine protein kinase
MAPERLKGGPLRKPCDVYAFGMLIYEVCITYFLPFRCKSILQLHANANPLNLHVEYREFMRLVVEGLRPEIPDEAPQLTYDIWQLAERCWRGIASERPSIDEVCSYVALSMNANRVPWDRHPQRPDRDEARRVNDGNRPANAVPRDGGPSPYVPDIAPPVYETYQAGTAIQPTGEPGTGLHFHAWCFFLGFVIFPFWWVGSYWAVPTTSDPQVKLGTFISFLKQCLRGSRFRHPS